MDPTPPEQSSVTTWIARLKGGDAEAARRLWDRYYARLLALARDRTRGVPLRASDEEDVALSAFHSFVRAAGGGRFPRLDDRDDLWQLLSMHTARKAVDLRRSTNSKKRGGPVTDAELTELAGGEPDPQLVAAAADEFDRLFGLLGSPDLCDVARCKLDGFTNPEVARKLGWSLSTVERKLKLIRSLWSAEAADAGAGEPP